MQPTHAQTGLRILYATAMALLLSAFFVGTAVAQEGNRGTVKIHDGAAEPEPIMRNEPKVCDFHVHAFQFNASQQLTINIVGHGGPNAGDSTYSGTITTDGNGEARDPATGSIDLDDGMYKLSVSTGLGGDKHKVFKVDCAGAAPNGDGPGQTPRGDGPGQNPGDDGPDLPETATESPSGGLGTLLLAAAVTGVVLLAIGGLLLVPSIRKGVFRS